MSGLGLYDSLQIAYEFMEQAKQLAQDNDYDAASAAMEKAKSYAFNNTALLDDIQLRCDALNNARQHYIKQLETEAANLFSRENFDGKQARQVLQVLLDQDGQSELVKSLWAELPAKETAEREHRLVDEFRNVLKEIWQRAKELEGIGAGSRAVAEYERALVEASKKAGDIPTAIPLQHLKSVAAEKRDQAKERWVGTPTLILAQKGQELVDRYETLKNQGEIETEFFDENGEFLGRLPIEECIDRAKKMASRFAEQKAQDYLGQAREVLAESPGAAYDKVQDALSLAYPSDFATSILEQELKDKIEPAMQLRENAQAKLNASLSTEDPLEAWAMLREAEEADRFIPGLEDARQRLLPMLEQRCTQLIEASRRPQKLEDFETARERLEQAIDIGQMVFAYGEQFQSLHSSAQEAFERCVDAERDVKQFDLRLDNIAQLSQTNPEQAKEQLANLIAEELSGYATAKVERLQVQIDFKLGVDQLFQTLEEKMLTANEATELIPIEEGIRQAALDYPDEERFRRLIDRVITRRFFLRGSRLRENPDQYLEARELLQRVINDHGDDADTAQDMVDEITANEQQEADIDIAVQEAVNAFDDGDVRSAFSLLEPYRHAVSRQADQIRQLLSTAASRWRNEIDQELETLVAAGDFSLPKIDLLIRELEHSQSPRLAEWQVRVLAPAYVNTARDLQELNRWEQANSLWETAFRLAPSDPRIVEGRRNAQKHRALIRAQMALDPTEKEQLLNDLNRVYGDDPTTKRYLAEFYYTQDRYVEARLAISQVRFLAEHLATSTSSADTAAIRQIETLIENAEKIEKRKLAIHSQLTGQTAISTLRDARLAYEHLIEDTPDQAEKLQVWWSELIKETVNQMKAQVSKLSDVAGTVWIRAELLCKILALQSDPQIQEQAGRMLKLNYSQLPSDVQSVVDNPKGVGYGPATQALPNHIAKAKDLYKKLINMSQVERIATDLRITVAEHALDLNHILYLLELTLEKLYFAREKQREIKNQIVVALMTGKWEAIEDNLRELEIKGLSKHRGLQELSTEVEQTKAKRADLETAVEQLKEAMAGEAFKIVRNRLDYLLATDPTDEAQLQSSLEVTDPYTNLRIRGHRELGAIIAEKLTVLEQLRQWQAACKLPVSWQMARLKMNELANRGDFTPAIQLGRAVAGQSDKHQTILQDDSWSLGHVRQYLGNPPVTQDELNNAQAQALFDQADQTVQTLIKQLNECDLLVQELRRKENEFAQILNDLTPLSKQLNESKDFFSSILSPSTEIQEIKLNIVNLVKRGQQLCPRYPAFVNFDERMLSRSRR